MASSEQSQIEDLVESLQEKKNATRRNLDSLGTMGVMDLGDTDVAFSDVILLFCSFMAFLVIGNIVPDGRNWAIGALTISCLLIGGTLLGIYVSPPGMSFYKWLKCKKGFMFGSDYRSAHKGDSGRITKDSLSTNGDRRALEDLTRVDGFAPQAGGVWRFDGALVGGCSIDPAELSLSSKSEWEDAADELGNIINSLDHSGQLRNGSVKIDTEAVKRTFSSRLGDTDVRSNPNLQMNVAMYKNKLPAQMSSKNASIRGFQFLAPVTMEEVQMQGHRVLGRINKISVIGERIASLLSSRDLTVAEIRYRQERVLQERRASIRKNLSGITGCDAEELSMDDVISILEESWTGERVVTEERDDRSLPLVTMTREYTETQGDTRSPDQLSEDELDQQIMEDLQRSGVRTDQQPDEDADGSTDLSDETLDRRTVSADDLETETEPEPEPEVEPEPEPSGPEPVPDRPQMGTERTTPDEHQEAQEQQTPTVDVDDYETIEDACAALIEEMEREDHASDADADRQEVTV